MWLPFVLKRGSGSLPTLTCPHPPSPGPQPHLPPHLYQPLYPHLPYPPSPPLYPHLTHSPTPAPSPIPHLHLTPTLTWPPPHLASFPWGRGYKGWPLHWLSWCPAEKTGHEGCSPKARVLAGGEDRDVLGRALWSWVPSWPSAEPSWEHQASGAQLGPPVGWLMRP